jgi:DNA polymerase I-like protein with 3'-5' exonuclease and polymerase domains
LTQVKYGVRDVRVLFPIMDQQNITFDKLKLRETAELEFSIVPCTAELELDGIKLYTEKLKHIISYWAGEEIRLTKEILDLYHEELGKLGKNTNFLFGDIKDSFDVKSNKDKLEILEELGYQLENVQRATLKEVDYKLAQMLGELSGITKMTSTYGPNMLERVNKYSGLWHPSFYQIGAGDSESRAGGDGKGTVATGRYSSDAQQFPRPRELYTPFADSTEYQTVRKEFEVKIKALKQESITHGT